MTKRKNTAGEKPENSEPEASPKAAASPDATSPDATSPDATSPTPPTEGKAAESEVEHPLDKLERVLARVEELEAEVESSKDKAKATELRLNQLISRALTPVEQQSARQKLSQRISTRKLAATLHRAGKRQGDKVHVWLIKDRDMLRPFKFLSSESVNASVVKAEYEKSTGRSWTGADDDPLQVVLSKEAA